MLFERHIATAFQGTREAQMPRRHFDYVAENKTLTNRLGRQFARIKAKRRGLSAVWLLPPIADNFQR
jgi:hypothetical protein